MEPDPTPRPPPPAGGCATHPTRAATFYCDGCGRRLCDECIESGHRLLFCRHCRERALPLAADGAATPAERGGDLATRAVERVTMKTALDDLPEAQRQVVELAYWDGLTQAEIAERLRQPLGTVKTRTRRALRHLRDGMVPVPVAGPAVVPCPAPCP